MPWQPCARQPSFAIRNFHSISSVMSILLSKASVLLDRSDSLIAPPGDTGSHHPPAQQAEGNRDQRIKYVEKQNPA